MIMCPNCKQESEDGAVFCDNCGATLSQPGVVSAAYPAPAESGPVPATAGLCPQCGSPVMPGAAFCDSCGAPLTAAQGAAPVSQQPYTPSIQAYPPPGQPAASQPPVPSQAGQPRLVVQGTNASITMQPGKSEYLIGREDPVSNIFPDVDLTPHGGDEGGVSRRHARLFAQGGQWFIEDYNTTNFTFVNNQKLQPRTPALLQDGAELRLGRVKVTFYLQ